MEHDVVWQMGGRYSSDFCDPQQVVAVKGISPPVVAPLQISNFTIEYHFYYFSNKNGLGWKQAGLGFRFDGSSRSALGMYQPTVA